MTLQGIASLLPAGRQVARNDNLKTRTFFFCIFCLPATLAAFQYELTDVQTALDRHNLRQLEAIATEADKDLRLKAMEALPRLKEPQTLPFFVSLLDDPDPDIVQAALWVLPSYGTPA